MRRLLLALPLLGLGCGGDVEMPANAVCVQRSAGDDSPSLVAVQHCASDHVGADLSCEVVQDEDGSFRVEAIYTEAKRNADPNDACADDLLAFCLGGSSALDGESLRYLDAETPSADVPVAPAYLCITDEGQVEEHLTDEDTPF